MFESIPFDREFPVLKGNIILLAQKDPVFITGDALSALTPEVYLTLRRKFSVKKVFQTPSGDAVFRILPSSEKRQK